MAHNHRVALQLHLPPQHQRQRRFGQRIGFWRGAEFAVKYRQGALASHHQQLGRGRIFKPRAARPVQHEYTAGHGSIVVKLHKIRCNRAKLVHVIRDLPKAQGLRRNGQRMQGKPC